MPIFDPDGKCPLLNKKCIKHQCIWYNMLQGKNPQTGMDVQEWGCSIAWIPLLLVENSKHIIGTTAATESFRNEVVTQNNKMNKLLQDSPTAKKIMKNTGSLFKILAEHQTAVKDNIPELEDETIRQLSNNKVKAKKGKKVTKNVNNNK